MTYAAAAALIVGQLIVLPNRMVPDMPKIKTPAAGPAVRIYQTSKSGDQMTEKAYPSAPRTREPSVAIRLDPQVKHQTILGFGAAFTESSGYLLSQLPEEKRNQIIRSYFSPDGAAFSLMRTHIGGCDFSLSSYSYLPVPGDTNLENFTIDRDRRYLIPLIQQARKTPGASFRLFASPWTPPPWMKDNNDYVGGALKKEYYPLYARYLLRYLEEYRKDNIALWGMSVQNEPENGQNWDTCVWGPFEERDFIAKHFGPLLAKENWDVKLIAYDHNKANMETWAKAVFEDAESARYVWGIGVHWYDSYVGIQEGDEPNYWFDNLETVNRKYPDKKILATEACTTKPIQGRHYWGLWPDWTGMRQVAAERYGIDIIGDLNAHAVGWVEWNMVLDFNGGPNHASNFCGAPVMVNTKTRRVLYNPSFYILSHFSKFIRPDAVRIGLTHSIKTGVPDFLHMTAFQNPDKTIAVQILNTNNHDVGYQITVDGKTLSAINFHIDPHALQTVVIRI